MRRATRLPFPLALGALLAWLFCVAPTTAHAQETEPLAIVVNRNNPLNEISLVDLRRVFRGQRSRWSNGRRVTLVMRDPGTRERQAILQSLYGVAEDDYHRTYMQAVFSGETTAAPNPRPPTTGWLRFVYTGPGAIGSVRARAVDARVKPVRVDGRLPGEPGYRLEVDAQ